MAGERASGHLAHNNIRIEIHDTDSEGTDRGTCIGIYIFKIEPL